MNKNSENPLAQLQIAIPAENGSGLLDDIQNGEENLKESSEKKKNRLYHKTIPKTQTMKTGTHLGHNLSTQNIFLSKF